MNSSKKVDLYEAYEEFDAWIDENEPSLVVLGYEFLPAEVLRVLMPDMYEYKFREYLDNRYTSKRNTENGEVEYYREAYDVD